MEKTKKIITAVLSVVFAFSLFSTIHAFASSNIFKIENATLAELSTSAEGNISSFDDSNIVSNVTFHKLDDIAKYVITLKNVDSSAHVIESITNDNTNPYISYIHDSYANTTVAAGANLDFIVTAKYTTELTDTNSRVQSTSVKFIISYLDAEDEEIIVVPNTGENAATPSAMGTVWTNTTVLIISGVGLAICAFITIKKSKRVHKSLIVFVVSVLGIAITARVRASTIEINSFTITSSFGIFDKAVVTYVYGDNTETETLSYGEKITKTVPAKTGYTADGWTTDGTTIFNPDTEVLSDITLIAKYTANTYTVRFNRNGATAGEDMTTQVFTYDQAQNLTKNTFVFPGRTYGGWDTETNGSGVHYDDEASVKNLTAEDGAIIDLYAQWSVNPYRIAYDANGGEGEMAETTCEYDQDCQLRTNAFTKLGYDFNGWKLDETTYADNATVRNLATSGTVTLVAQWQVHEYSIAYTGLTDAEATALRTAGNPDTYTIETPSFTLHNPDDRYDTDGDKTQHFEGWRESTVSTEITLPQVSSLGNKIYEAIWSDVATPEYNITYDYDNGTATPANRTKFTKFDTFTLTEPTKTGYTFTGWTGTDLANETKPYTVPTGIRHDLEFTAHYRKNNYTIAFAKGADDATGVTASIAAEYDTEYDLPASGFARTGYTQNGWKKGEEAIAADAKVKNLTAEDGATVTLTANWEANKFTVVYHANSDAVSNPTAMNNQVVTYDEAATLTPNAYEREHYKFMGWATSATGGKVYDDQADITNALSEDGGILNLYAVWKERTAILNIGPNVNAVLRSFAEEPQSFSHFNGTPDFEAIQNEQNIALASSNFPVYAWYDEADQAIYWWSEAERPQLNTASAKLFSGTHTENNASVNNSLRNLKSIDLTGLDASSTLYMDSMFANTTSLESLNLDDFDSSSAVDMRSMFYGTNLAGIDLSQIESQNVTNMSYMFSNSKFGNIDASKLNTQSVTNMSGMFRNAAATTIKFFDNDPTDSLFDTSKVTDMASMFYGVHVEELDLRNFNTEQVLSFNSMFLYADPIKKLDVTSFNTSNATNMGYMFDQLKNLEELDVTGFNTSKVTNMSNMFNSCAKLTELNLTNFDTSKVTLMDGMFAGLKNMEVLDLSSFNTGKVTTMYYYFVEANKLKTVYISDLWSTDALSPHGGTFFQSQSAITGGAGTRMAQTSTSDIYARIDDPDNNGKKGMFTYKNARYIRYHDNDEDDTNNEANYALMPSHYITTDSNNPYTLATALSENKFERPGYRFLGWATSADGEKLYDDKAAISTSASKDPLELYAVWYRLDATLDTGANVNTILKNLATEPTAFVHYAAGTPNFDVIDGEQDIALSTSDVPVYVWYDAESTKIYWWSEAVRPKMNTDSSSFFAGMSSVTSIDVEGLDASNATNMSHMFRGTGLTDIDFSKLESQNVTDMSYMFYGIKKTNTLDVSKLDTSSVRNMASMFEGATFSSISFFDTLNPSVSKFKTNEVTSMHYMFKDATKLTSLDLSSFNTSNVRDFSGTFYGATGLKTLNLDGWDTGNATTMYIMFNNAPSLTRLDLSHFDTKNVTTMQQMFEGCFNLEYLNVSGWSNEKVGNMSYMFHKVGNYKNGVEIILTGFKTPAVTSMAYMFTRDVTELETLDLSSFDTSNVTSMSSMFGGGSQGNGTFYNAKIKTVYASDKFVTTKVDPESNVFNNTSVIVGGAGTTWSQKTAAFARIDDPDNGEPGYFTLKGARYIRYNGNGADNATPYGTMTSEYLKAGDSLKKNAFTRNGYEFAGWKDADNNEYTDEQVMADLTESKTPLELYAQWNAKSYAVTFNANGGEVLQGAKTVKYQQPYGELPTPVRYDYVVDPNGSILGSKYGFKEWNAKADGTGETITSSSIYENTDNITLYAIWNDQFTVTIYNGESETPTIANYGIDSVVDLNAQNVDGKQFLYWEVDGAKKSYIKDYGMRMFQGKDLTIRAIYGSESDSVSQQPGTYVSDIYRQYDDNRIVVRSYSYVPDGYEIVKAGVIATLDANIANGILDDQTATYPRAASVNGSSDNYYYTWTKSNVTSDQTVYVKAYLIYKDADGVEHTIYGDLVTATLTE